MQQKLKTVRQTSRVEIVERKSRFIAVCRPINTESEAQELIDAERQMYRDASHHVYAWIIRSDILVQRFSDDREPQGTAGKPILNLLSRLELEHTAIVVTRYFGGTLLGTGGLSRAYSKAATLAVEQAGIVDLYLCQRFQITVDYAGFDRLNRAWNNQSWIVEKPDYGSQIKTGVIVPVESIDHFNQLSSDVTAGAINIVADAQIYRPLPPPDPPPDLSGKA